MSKEFITICPRCGSANTHQDLTKEMILWGGSTRHHCHDCKFSATFFPSIHKDDLTKFRNNIKKRSIEQNKQLSQYDVSKGYIKKWITIPILAAIAIILIFVIIGLFM